MHYYSKLLEERVVERTHELRHAQEELFHKEKLALLGELAGGVSHEIRSPLATISNAIYFLKLVQQDADEKIQEYLDIISFEVDEIAGILSDTLDINRVKHPQKQHVDTPELLSWLIERKPPPGNITVVQDVPDDIPPLWVDPRQIRQVLLNLTRNAYQAMPDGGTITIKATFEDHMIEISITDTGCGIPPENIVKIFQPLFTTKTRGVGLGLSISKNLVEANEGKITVESEEGLGSTFKIKFPIVYKQ